jgi:glutathione S-transferase
MRDSPQAARAATRPKHVWVYGNDHSPWVQAVLLGLHEKGIPYTLVTSPPLSVFLGSGVLMPAARIDDGPWLLDSGRILAELGFSKVEPDERRALQAIFLSGAMRRSDDPWKFWQRFSYVRDGHPVIARRLGNQLWRPFSMLYFFTLIRVGRRAWPSPTTGELIRQYGFWQERLVSGAEFLGGSAPDTVDLQLFGLVQMCASIPGPSFAVLRREPELQRLRIWIEAMQSRFSDYPRLYSAPHFAPELPEIEPAPALERLSYWCGAALMWIALPITLPTVLYYVRRVRKKGLQRP